MTPPRRSLVLRLYGVGLAQLVGFGALASLVGWLGMQMGARAHDRAWDVAREVSALDAHVDDPPGMARALGALRRSRGVEVTVFDRGGRMVATNVTPPLTLRGPNAGPRAGRPLYPHLPFGPPPMFRERQGQLGPHPLLGPPSFDEVRRIDLAGTAGFVLVRPAPDAWSLLPAALTFVAALVVVAIGSWVLSRSIVRPLKSLADAARRIGSGDLKTRIASTRGDELGEVSGAFDAMAERIERLLRAEKALLANVSHELRTPLARIRVALDLATEGDSAAAKSAMSEIAIDLGELEQLVDDVMTTTRIALDDGDAHATSLRPRLAPTTVQALCERSARRLRSHHPAHVLETDVPPVSVDIVVDATLFRRSLDNVLDNAVKYSAEGSTIALRATCERESVVFEIEDHGIGIAERDLPHLFVPFFRADASRTRATGGVGLGLTLAKRIVEEHHGSIDVTSTLGAGTRVRITIPRVPEP